MPNPTDDYFRLMLGCDAPVAPAGTGQFAARPWYPGYPLGNYFCAVCCQTVLATLAETALAFHQGLGYHVCPTCRDRFRECRVCLASGPWSDIGPDLGHSTDDPHFYCHSCLDRFFLECERCSNWCDRTDTHYANDTDSHYCEACWTRIDGFNCENCGDDFTGRRYGSEGVCRDCEREHEDEYDEDDRSGFIRSYGHTRAMQYFGAAKDRIYFGVELEVSCHGVSRGDAAEATWRRFDPGFVELKEDGSIDYGFEIVSQPATLDYHRIAWENFFASVPTGLDSWRTGSCGMHVHVSRRPLSQLQIAKVSAFLNEDATRDFVVSLAGRDDNGYCAKEKKDRLSRYSTGHQRYVSLNLTNAATIEFRIFRGTIRPQGFFKNLEFAHALVYFARKVGNRELTVLRFAKFVRRFRRTYPNLAAWMIRHGHMAPVSKPRPQGMEVPPVRSTKRSA